MSGVALPTANSADASKGQQNQTKDGNNTASSVLQDYKNSGGADAAIQQGLPLPVLQNIVATVNLEVRLDLKTIALHARNAEYNPKVNSCGG